MNKTLLQPVRLTLAQRDALALGANDTAHIFNTSVGDYQRWDGTSWIDHTFVDMSNWPAFFATGGPNVAVASSTLTAVTFNTTTFNIAGSYSTATGVFTVPPGDDGFYQFTTSIRIGLGTTTGEAYVTITRNGDASKRGPLASDDGPGALSYGYLATGYQLTSGDTVDVRVWAVHTGTRNAQPSLGHFTGIRIR